MKRKTKKLIQNSTKLKVKFVGTGFKTKYFDATRVSGAEKDLEPYRDFYKINVLSRPKEFLVIFGLPRNSEWADSCFVSKEVFVSTIYTEDGIEMQTPYKIV